MMRCSGTFTGLFLIAVCCTRGLETEIVKVYSIFENRHLGFYVGNIAQDTDILQNVSQEIRENIRFTFVPNEFSRYFILDDVTGDLNTSDVNIDRDVICEFTDVCIMKLEIYVQSKTYLGLPAVQVIILDENDNAPAFINTKSNPLSISELETVGSAYPIGEVYDADLPGNNSIQNFGIIQNEEKFGLKVEKNHDTFTLGIILKETLDRELQGEYMLWVIVEDGGEPALTGTHEIRVRVEDANDNSPIFERVKYNVTIDENILPNTVFLSVSANDTDVGRNAEIRYRIRERQSNVDAIKRLFAIDERSGDIYVTSDLRHEPMESYEFYVEATDQGTMPKTNSTIVQILVNDVENNAPTIQINLLSPASVGNTVCIEENQPVNYVVAHVYVEDNDKGDNGKFTCNSTNPLFMLEKIHGRGFKIVLDDVLDREEASSHDVTVTCHDHGVDSKEASKEFFVKVTDINDNDPVFDKIQYAVSIKENNSIGEIITRVNARDADFGANGTVEYQLAKPEERFIIDITTGVISANRSLDREEHDTVIFPVLAVDHGPVRRTVSVTVSVNLIDINDNPPAIFPKNPKFWIPENRPSNVTVGVLQAMDLDINDGHFYFTIAPLSNKLPFEITTNGELRTTEPLDRELHNRYDIPVTVSDLDLSNTQHVTIHVLDENDNSPKITFPNGDNDTVTFKYGVDLYNVVTTVAAHDIDTGLNGSLNFTITGGNGDGIFEIDPDLGEVSIIKYVTIDNDFSVTLDIEVKDRGIVPRSSRCKLKVILTVPSSSGAKRIISNQNKQYVLISAIVVVTTVVVAIAIVGVIVLLRKLDSQKKREGTCARYSNTGISSFYDLHHQERDFPNGCSPEGMTEVRFSLDYQLAGLDGGLNVETNTDDFNRRYYDAVQNPVTLVPRTCNAPSQERMNSHMNALKLQQYLLLSKRLGNHQEKPIPVGDSESETSRETNTCDSGRGGSVEDVSTSSPGYDDKSSFGNLQESKTIKKVTFGSHYYNHDHFSQTLCTPSTPSPVSQCTSMFGQSRPPPYKSTDGLRGSKTPQDRQKLALGTLRNPAHYDHVSKLNKSNLSIHQGDSTRHFDLWRDISYQNGRLPLRMRHDSGSSFRSNDDDHGSTTTSGSYTLEQIDMEKECVHGHKRDSVV